MHRVFRERQTLFTIEEKRALQAEETWREENKKTTCIILRLHSMHHNFTHVH